MSHMKEFYFIATDNLKLKDFKIKYLMPAKNICNVKYDSFSDETGLKY